MRTAIGSFQLVQPHSLAEALRIIREEPQLQPIAGCTDVYVQLEFGQASATRYIDIWKLDELRSIEVRADTLVLGALTTYTDAIRSSVVQQWLPMLVSASRLVGGVQIQNRGTLGGNIANGSPAGDSLPVFAAVDATVVLRSADNERRVPFNTFYAGYRKTVMQPGELIVAIEVPRVDGAQWFRKVGTRAAQAISKLVIAAVRNREPRVAIGSVAPTVIRARHAESALARGSLADAQQALMQDIAPIDDLRSTADYRRRVSANLLARFWHDTA